MNGGVAAIGVGPGELTETKSELEKFISRLTEESDRILNAKYGLNREHGIYISFHQIRGVVDEKFSCEPRAVPKGLVGTTFSIDLYLERWPQFLMHDEVKRWYNALLKVGKEKFDSGDYTLLDTGFNRRFHVEFHFLDDSEEKACVLTEGKKRIITKGFKKIDEFLELFHRAGKEYERAKESYLNATSNFEENIKALAER